MGPGFRLTLPRHSVHPSGAADMVTLTRDEAVDLMHRLFEMLGGTQRQGKAE